MKSISTEFADGRIIKPSYNKCVELHSWSIRNPKGLKKLKIKAAHFHNEFQIGYVKKGLIENSYRNQKTIIKPNQLYVIEPYEIHAEYLVQEKEVCFDFIFIPINLMKQAGVDLPDRNTLNFQDLVIKDRDLNFLLIQKLQTIFNSYQNFSTLLEREQHLIDFILLLSNVQPGLKERDFRKVSKQVVERLKIYMSENIFTAISLDILANEMAMSKFHLGRIFLAETNMTMHKYLMNLKICKAKELLNSDNSIADVALKLGFTDKSHFIKCFKRATAETPGEFRNL